MQKSYINFGAFLTVTLLLVNMIMNGILLMDVSSSADDVVESLTTNEACGQCLDVAYEGADDAFSFVNCNQDLKRFEITRENGETEFVWSSDVPNLTKEETLESIRRYDDIDSTAFQRSFEEDWFEMKRDPEYVQGTIIILILLSVVSCFLLTLSGIASSCVDKEYAPWVSFIGLAAITIFNFFVWMCTVVLTASAEIQQPRTFGEIECLVIPNGYPFYRTMLNVSVVSSTISIFLIILGLASSSFSSGEGGSWGLKESAMVCQLVTLVAFFITYVVNTILGCIVLHTVHFDTGYGNWLICLGVACAVVGCFIFAIVPFSDAISERLSEVDAVKSPKVEDVEAQL